MRHELVINGNGHLVEVGFVIVKKPDYLLKVIIFSLILSMDYLKYVLPGD